MNFENYDEYKFWQEVFIACIKSPTGLEPGSTFADLADRAVLLLRERTTEKLMQNLVPITA